MSLNSDITNINKANNHFNSLNIIKKSTVYDIRNPCTGMVHAQISSGLNRLMGS